MERERRTHERQPYRTTLTIEHSSRTWSGFVENCSEGGLYAISYIPAHTGDEVRVWFERPRDSMMVVLEGQVTRLSTRGVGAGEPMGVGIRFLRELTHAAICL